MLVNHLRFALSAVLSGVLVSGLVTALPAHADRPAVLFVDNTAGVNCSDAGSGTEAQPFCTVQPAADVARPGQTVVITGEHFETVSVTRSGTKAAPIVFDGRNSNFSAIRGIEGTAPTVRITRAHDITFREMRIFGGRPSGEAVLIDGSHRITVDRDYVLTSADATVPTIHVTGGSSFVTVSRTKIGQSFAGAMRVDPGGSHVTITANDISDTASGGISVTATPRTVITGNTILRSCNAAVSLTGESPGSSVRNNIIGYVLDQSRSQFRCPAAPVVTGLSVDAAAAPGVRVGYNIVYPFFDHAPYQWAGTSYASASDLLAATGRGRHDLNVEPGVRLDSFSPILTEGSPAIDSADADAPGELDTDSTGLPRVDDPLVANTGAGAVSYHDRGAFEWQNSVSDAAGSGLGRPAKSTAGLAW